MKRLYQLLFICILAIAVTSCRKTTITPHDSKSSSSSIVGKWHYNKVVIVVYINDKKVSESVKDDYDAFTQFNSDGTGNSSDSQYAFTFKYKLTGKTLTFSEMVSTGTPLPEGGIMGSEATITKLTATELETHAETATILEGFSYKAVQDTYMSKL